MTKSVYIHIPFCNSICSYCDFCKLLYNEKLVDDYLDSLKNEIIDNYKGEILNTIYIGGGTPSSLSIKQLNKLFEIIKIFKINKNYEFTIEMNLSDISREKLDLFKKNKVNRISIGVESVNPKYFKFLNRESDKKEVIEKINIVKEYFNNFNIDLMYAFPNQTVKEVLDDLSFIISLNPTHISIYSLIIEEHTKIFIDRINPIKEELEEKMYYNIIKELKKNNYIHYEISNFAKKGFESIHNQVYWNNDHYYGFGLGSAGFINNTRCTNTRSINKYLNGNYLLEKEEISKDIDMENEMIFGLRKIKGVNKETFFNKYGINIYDQFDIISLIDKKLLIDDGKNIYIPEDKLYIQNSILINFIGGKNE